MYDCTWVGFEKFSVFFVQHKWLSKHTIVAHHINMYMLMTPHIKSFSPVNS